MQYYISSCSCLLRKRPLKNARSLAHSVSIYSIFLAGRLQHLLVFARGCVQFINLVFTLLNRTEHVLCDICVLRLGYVLLW